ncbi:hypothetical protein BH11PSE12_BH11PSE12_14100 [soil metagenome]
MKLIQLVSAVGFMLAATLSQAQTPMPVVDTSVDGIFSALTSSHDLQATVDTLIANGANQRAVIAIAAAAGISQDKVQELQVCVNTVSDDVRVLSATCMRPRSVMTAYAAGMNDPLNYLPATAAGKREDQSAK